MAQLYDPSAIEAKWQKRWEEEKTFEIDLSKAKDPYYLLVMFPYPSGYRLHVGHWFQYSIPDSYGRFLRMKGKDVFHPMGFDAFGLPAENFAIKTGTPPAQSIKENVHTMVEQFKRMGVTYDWTKVVNTTDPEYYRWTQWLFLQMYEHKLAYKKEANVNWCPKDQTVLAREQAQDGFCERCGTQVVQKSMPQWFWKITDYAQRLLDGHNDLDWPEKTKLMQRNWIGRSEGTEVHFNIDGHDDVLKIFTTRVDTLFGCTFVVLAPEHPLVEKIVTKDHKGAVQAYIQETRNKTELQRTDLNKDKTGTFTGSYAVNPANGQKVPIWIADFVLAHYGTGAVFADAHDERDFIFAKKYGIPLKPTLKPADGSDDSKILNLEESFTGDGILYDSGEFSGLHSAEARKKIAAWLEDKEKGRLVTQYRLKDWLVSRQRYWGAPIPIVYDPEGNAHPIPDKHLPWLLPTDVEFKPNGESPLRQSKEFIERTEKIFGKGWTPEFDTMDTFVCSSFYYLRFLAMGDQKKLVDPHLEKQWMPVDTYIGGPEHACMHLIYARFVYMALRDFGFVQGSEPFKRLIHQGLITNQGAKMSKSKNNVVSPDELVEKHGSDVFRMYLMFMGPFTEGGDWSDTGIKGIDRFVLRVYRLFADANNMNNKSDQNKELMTGLHKTIKSVGESIEKMQFNTAISAMMELLNMLEGKPVPADILSTFAVLLSPLAPHLAEELWEMIGGKGFVANQKWPVFDPKLLISDTMTIVVQVNGKLRGDMVIASSASKEEIIAQAKELENVKKYLEGTPKKEVYVPGKLVSFVL